MVNSIRAYLVCEHDETQNKEFVWYGEDCIINMIFDFVRVLVVWVKGFSIFGVLTQLETSSIDVSAGALRRSENSRCSDSSFIRNAF
jgi:hypothetical protein